jgi:hypothetical protein
MTVNAGWGTSLKKCLADILMRCRETVEPTNIPGEGGERALKGWIAHPFLTEQLGWPIERIVQGERFDLRLNSAESLPVIYIETKSPGHIPSGKEREDFENRIASYGTLRSAVLTNGRSWERLSLTAPRGSVTIAHRYLLDLDRCSDEEIEAFFLPLKAERYIAGGYDTGRSRVSRANPHILASLAADLDQGVGDLSDYFERLFAAYEAGGAGGRGTYPDTRPVRPLVWEEPAGSLEDNGSGRQGCTLQGSRTERVGGDIRKSRICIRPGGRGR